MSTTDEIPTWPTIGPAEMRVLLKRVREKAGLVPRKQTLVEARRAGYIRGVRDTLRHLERLVTRDASNE